MADKDLDGLIFCDSPWVLTHPLANKNWPEAFNSYGRLYALGRDSFALSTHLRELSLTPGAGIHDETGVFYATPSKNLTRDLVFRQFNKGAVKEVCLNKSGP